VADKWQLHFTNSLTLAAVVNPSRVDLVQNIVNKWYGQDSYMLSVSGGRYRFTLVTPGGTWGQPHEISAPATAGAWAHVVGTYDGQTMALSVNGQRVAQAPLTGSLQQSIILQQSSQAVRIGNWPSGNAFYGDLAFTLTRTGGLTTNDFVVNADGYYFSADLTDGRSTGAQAWATRTIGGGGQGSVVPEPSTSARRTRRWSKR
jgi:hypothetical protein